MEEKMRAHIEKLFEDAPKTRKAFELKEELLANSQERYQDLVANGVKTEDAFKNVISSIGDVSELFRDLEERTPEDRMEFEARTKKYAVVKTAAVGLYFFSVVLFLACALIDQIFYYNVDLTSIGLILMLLLSIIPTCMLVYINSIYPKYKRSNDTVVEEFKEWKNASRNTKSVKGAAIFAGWSLILVLYFVISFATFAWYVTWIIFLVGACIHAIIELLFRLKDLKS